VYPQRFPEFFNNIERFSRILLGGQAVGLAGGHGIGVGQRDQILVEGIAAILEALQAMVGLRTQR